jgi:hypothetical protein
MSHWSPHGFVWAFPLRCHAIGTAVTTPHNPELCASSCFLDNWSTQAKHDFPKRAWLEHWKKKSTSKKKTPKHKNRFIFRALVSYLKIVNCRWSQLALLPRLLESWFLSWSSWSASDALYVVVQAVSICRWSPSINAWRVWSHQCSWLCQSFRSSILRSVLCGNYRDCPLLPVSEACLAPVSGL